MDYPGDEVIVPTRVTRVGVSIANYIPSSKHMLVNSAAIVTIGYMFSLRGVIVVDDD